jgi:hypothetical protein
MWDIHSDELGAGAKQGASAGDGSAFNFFLFLKVIALIGSFYNAAFDFVTLVVKLRFLLPHTEV